MTQLKNRADVANWNPTLMGDLTDPIILEERGQPIAVLMSITAYEQYQAMLNQQGQISARDARRLANQAVFADLVGCALSSGQPTWQPDPEPHWQIPYYTFAGILLKVVEVNALTGEVSLTSEERMTLLNEVERLVLADAT